MITCRELNDLVTDFLERRMSSLTRFKFRLHLLLCPECKLHVIKMEQMINALGQIPSETEIPEQVLRGFAQWSGK